MVPGTDCVNELKCCYDISDCPALILTGITFSNTFLNLTGTLPSLSLSPSLYMYVDYTVQWEDYKEK